MLKMGLESIHIKRMVKQAESTKQKLDKIDFTIYRIRPQKESE